MALPDVPNLPSRKMPEAKFPAANMRPLPLDGAPMDISTFEANLGMESKKAPHPFVDADSGVFADLITPGLGDDPENDVRGAMRAGLSALLLERGPLPVCDLPHVPNLTALLERKSSES